MAGRPPKPTAVLKLQGTAEPGRIAKRGVELKTEPGFPDAPDWLTKAAKLEWDYIRETHAAGVITRVDCSSLAVYCQMLGRYIDSERAVPYVMLPASFISTMNSLGGKLGLEPSSRVRLGSPNTPEKDDSPWEQFSVIDGGKKQG